MWPIIFKYSWFELSYFGIYLVIAAVWFSFIVWKKLRLDSTSTEIFELTINIYSGLFLGNLVMSLIEQGQWLAVSGWGMVIGSIWALWRWSRQNKGDFWEMFDWMAIGGLWFWFWGAIAYGPEAIYATIAALVSLIVMTIVRLNYRKFRWYVSGKMGIVGLFSVVMYGIYEIGFSLLVSMRVYWWGLTLGQTMAAWVIAFCLVTVYFRSGNKIKL